MKWLYLMIDVGTLLFPLALSFDRRVAFYQSWRKVLVAILLVGVPFLVWDVYFTKTGVWGFNTDYLCGIYLWNLPLEEVLFFLVVPYACLFIYACLKSYAAKIDFGLLNKVLLVLLILYVIFIAAAGMPGSYSVSVVISASLTLILLLIRSKFFSFFPVAFLISLIPFLLVNGALTGGYTVAPVVWYNDLENSGLLIFTIPAEDILYSFTLIGLNVWVFEWKQKY